MIRNIALAAALTFTACSPAHANQTVEIAFEMCQNLTQVVMAYEDSNMTREHLNSLIESRISEKFGRDTLYEMLDIAEASEATGFLLDLQVNNHCLKKTAAEIRAAQ